MRWVLLIVCLFCTGCFPVVQHGPWVRRGMSGAIGASGAVVAGAEDGGAGAVFNLDSGLRAGITPNDSSHHGASLGLQLPIIGLFDNDTDDGGFGFLKWLNVDGYFTGPDAGDLGTAFGIVSSRYHYMPYVQIGHYDDWYGTLAFMFVRDEDVLVIAPSYTRLRPAGSTAMAQTTLTAGFSTGDETLLLFGVSIIFEFHRKHARTGS